MDTLKQEAQRLHSHFEEKQAAKQQLQSEFNALKQDIQGLAYQVEELSAGYNAQLLQVQLQVGQSADMRLQSEVDGLRQALQTLEPRVFEHASRLRQLFKASLPAGTAASAPPQQGSGGPTTVAPAQAVQEDEILTEEGANGPLHNGAQTEANSDDKDAASIASSVIHENGNDEELQVPLTPMVDRTVSRN